ncbi:MAG TPA: DUF6798 domain-containing protein, partial [Pirellulales bacterium]|nr:DUF6798 domain-containing protein [Pirellulales bacterium]
VGREAEVAVLLRYYWFRMADSLIPLGVSLETIRGLALLRRQRPAWAAWGLAVTMLIAALHVGAVAIDRQQNLRPPADKGIANLAAWREICQWAAENTAPDAMFITPRNTQSFHWYAGRSEVAGYKDIPQDARAIVQWWQRIGDIYRQRSPDPDAEGFASVVELGRAKLEALGRKYHADYVIAGPVPRLALDRISPPNPSFVVYRLPQASETSPAHEVPAAEPQPSR